ncbi:MAG TPA: hypothetical protein VKN36_16095 [Eudoraea sp.]|nr:hypothetical protein [Eudoraea sp.]
MKKVMVTALLFTWLMGYAQGGEHHGDKKAGLQEMTPEQAATLKTKNLALALDLTEDQQTEIQKMHVEDARLRNERMAAYKSAKEEGELKKPTADELFKMQNDRLDRAIAQKEKMKQILTEAQFEKWEKIHARYGHHKKGMRKGKSRHAHKRNG